jgi:hypothetical protein
MKRYQKFCLENTRINEDYDPYDKLDILGFKKRRIKKQETEKEIERKNREEIEEIERERLEEIERERLVKIELQEEKTRWFNFLKIDRNILQTYEDLFIKFSYFIYDLSRFNNDNIYSFIISENIDFFIDATKRSIVSPIQIENYKNTYEILCFYDEEFVMLCFGKRRKKFPDVISAFEFILNEIDPIKKFKTQAE